MADHSKLTQRLGYIGLFIVGMAGMLWREYQGAAAAFAAALAPRFIP